MPHVDYIAEHAKSFSMNNVQDVNPQKKIDVKGCKIHNNFVGKIFAFLFNSDRTACIHYIHEHGEEAFAEKMAKEKQMTMKRK